ncbi:hypothetical protein I4U23_001620 [Adineta vaga]|nr:hypothetical protein I4U23_001620 [Adineta vaga]
MDSICSLINTSLLETDECNVETFSVTWLDPSVNGEDNAETLARLHANIKFIKVFERSDECEKYLQNMSPYDRTTLIVSGSLGKNLVPKIELYSQISSIYVFCVYRELYELWAKEHPKIKKVLTEYDDLVDEVVKDYNAQVKKGEPIAFNILKTTEGNNDLSSLLKSSFTHSHLLIDVLLHFESNTLDRSELFSFLQDQYRHDSDELRTLHQFQDGYSPNKALYWYTRDGFPYKLLNKAFRTQSIHLLYLFRFWIIDIYQQLFRHQYKTSIRVYRGQYMSTDELQLYRDSIGKIISINSFLSTSANLDVALRFIDIDDEFIETNLEKVLFVIDAIQPEYGDENEVLFSMNSIFRIQNIFTTSDNIQIIQLTLCHHDESELKAIFVRIKNHYEQKHINLLLFANILFEMKYYKEADIYYRRYLQMPPQNQLETCDCYEQLGEIALRKNDFQSSLNWQKQSLAIKIHLYKTNDIRLASNYYSLGLIYEKLNENKQALISYKQACHIWKTARQDQRTHLAQCYHKIGRIQRKNGKYTVALKYHKKVLHFWTRKTVPFEEIELGKLYYEIAYIYEQLIDHDKAIENYNLALKTYQKCISTQHIYIAGVFERLALIYRAQDMLIQSLFHYEQSRNIYQGLLQTKHAHLIQINANIINIQTRLKHDST